MHSNLKHACAVQSRQACVCVMAGVSEPIDYYCVLCAHWRMQWRRQHASRQACVCVMAGVSEPIEYYCVFCVHLTPALPRCASHKHVFECLSMHLQSGALARSEWDVPTAEPPLLHFYPAPTVYSLLARSHLPNTHAQACTATLCKPQACF